MKANIRLARWLIARPRLVAAVLVVIVATSAVLAPKVRSEAGISVYFDRSRPMNTVLRELHERFVGDDLLFAAYEADDIFTRQVLEEVRTVGAAIAAIRIGDALAVADVRSVASIDDLVGASSSFRTVPLVPTPVPDDTSAVRARALANPIVREQLLAPDGRTGGIVIRLEDGLDDDTKASAIATIRAALPTGGAASWALAGKAVLEADLARAQQEDLARFVPWVYAALALVVIAFVRRLAGVVVAMASVVASVVTGFAMLFATGSSLNNTSAMLAPAIMALNVALFVHFFSEYSHASGDRAQVLGELLPPIAVAELTTVLGFCGLAGARIPAVREFGVAAGCAVVVAFVTTTCILALVCRYAAPERLASPKGLVHSEAVAAFLATLSVGVVRYRRLILAAAAASVVAAVAGAMNIRVDEDMTHFFAAGAPIREATQLIDRELGGSTVLVAAIDGGRAKRFLEPDALRRLDALEADLRGVGIGRVLSASDYIALMHRELMGGAPGELRLPQTREGVAQLLLINGDAGIDDYLDAEQRWVRVVARAPKHNARAVLDLYAAIDQFLMRHFPPSEGFATEAVSTARLGAVLADELLVDQIHGIAWSGIPIFLIMVFMLRSVRLGVFSLLPNIYPIFMSFGVMGWCGIELNVATVMTATVALGIVVDDTVHFLRALTVALRAGASMTSAITATVRDKGVGMLGTASVIMLAFAVMLFSDFGPTHDFALLMCVVMSTALVGDLVILPAALATFGNTAFFRVPEPNREEYA